MIRNFQALSLSSLRNSNHFPGLTSGAPGGKRCSLSSFKYSLGLYSGGGAEQMAQWATVLCKHKDLSFNSQH